MSPRSMKKPGMSTSRPSVKRNNVEGVLPKANTELLEEYHITRDKGVRNMIPSYIIDNLTDVREIIDNMIKYGDPSVFKILPKEIDDKVKEYGLEIQQYFGKKSVTDLGSDVYIVPTTYKYCSKCGKYKSMERDFYQTGSDTSGDGYAHICKDCLKNLFNEYYKAYKDIREVLVLICMKIDVIVYQETLDEYTRYFNTEAGKNEFLNGSFLGNFLSDTKIALNSNGANMDTISFEYSNLNGIPFKCVKMKPKSRPIYTDKIVDSNEDVKKPIKIDSRHKWGDLDPEDIEWLETEYAEWDAQYEVKDKSQETILEQICLELLDIYHKRSDGGDTSKNLATMQKLLDTGRLSPKTIETNSETKGFTSIGQFIQYVETTRPIINKDPDFEDVDGIEKIVKSIAGAINRTLGNDDPTVQEFEDYYKDYTIDMSVVDGGYDEDD